jgi:hypothetical protein
MSIQNFSLVPAPFKERDLPANVFVDGIFTPPIFMSAYADITKRKEHKTMIALMIISQIIVH